MAKGSGTTNKHEAAPGGKKDPGYKDVHKRVKRLLQLKLIYQTGNHFERGAKHYRVTPYGAIASLDKSIFLPVPRFRDAMQQYGEVIYNKDNIVIQSLLAEFLEQKTINNFDKLLNSIAIGLMGYMHDCCSLATDLCKSFWSSVESYKITDILPSDDIIQKYMADLDGKPIDEHVLNEIKEYEERLKKRLDAGLAKQIEEDWS